MENYPHMAELFRLVNYSSSGRIVWIKIMIRVYQNWLENIFTILLDQCMYTCVGVPLEHVTAMHCHRILKTFSNPAKNHVPGSETQLTHL